MKCDLCSALEKETPNRIAALKSGIALVSFKQFFKGRSVMVFRRHVDDIRKLSDSELADFMADIKRLADAIEKAFSPDKLNYAILMNVEPHLHCHVIPRYRSDPMWGKNFLPHDDKSKINDDEKKQRSLAEKIREFLK